MYNLASHFVFKNKTNKAFLNINKFCSKKITIYKMKKKQLEIYRDFKKCVTTVTN